MSRYLLEPPNAIERILFSLEGGMSLVKALALDMLTRNLPVGIAVEYYGQDRMSLEINEVLRKKLSDKKVGKRDRPSTKRKSYIKA